MNPTDSTTSHIKIKDAFSDESVGIKPRDYDLKSLLKVDPMNPKRIVSRENSRLEYKQSFNWSNRAKYAKTIAAFANNAGGFIVFGIKDSPRELVGLTSERFEDQDPAGVTEYLNSKFAPELDWDWFSVEFQGSNIGVISVEPAYEKPVICIRGDGNDLRDADIYYRYRGRTERIRHAELQNLKTEIQRREREAFLKHLNKIARVGPEAIGVLDLNSGELSGHRRRVLISEELVGKVQFIREEASNTNDNVDLPTLQIVGSAEIVPSNSLLPIKTVIAPKAISPKDLMLGFLRQESVPAPNEFLKQAFREHSPNLPIYHFVRLAGMTLLQVRSMILRETPNRKQLLKRLGGALVKPVGSLAAKTPTSLQRLKILEFLRTGGEVDDALMKNRVLFLEAISHLNPSSTPQASLQALTKLVEDEFDAMNSTQQTAVRRAVAHLDEVLNRESCRQDEMYPTGK